VFAAIDTNETMEGMLEAVFSVWSVPSLYNEDQLLLSFRTSIVTLRVVEGDEKGSLKSETVNMVTSPKGLGPEKDCAGKGQQHIKRKTRLLVREGAPQKQNRNCQIVIYIWS
jgi:hypothetical protein